LSSVRFLEVDNFCFFAGLRTLQLDFFAQRFRFVMLSASADFVEIVVVRPSLKSGLRIFSVSFLFGLDLVAKLSSKLFLYGVVVMTQVFPSLFDDPLGR